MNNARPNTGLLPHHSTSVPGPHLCSAVGNNVSSVLRAALVEMCDHRNGTLTKDEIIHAFDLVENSGNLFFLYRQGYSHCVSLKDSPQFVDIDESRVTQFLTRAYCHDMVSQVCAKQIAARKGAWATAFVDGFADFLVTAIDKELPKRLFAVYQRLVTHEAGNLTPIKIMNSQDMIKAFAKTAQSLAAYHRDDPELAKQFETSINLALSKALKIKGPSLAKLNRPTSMALLLGLTKPSVRNPFRTAVIGSGEKKSTGSAQSDSLVCTTTAE